MVATAGKARLRPLAGASVPVGNVVRNRQASDTPVPFARYFQAEERTHLEYGRKNGTRAAGNGLDAVKGAAFHCYGLDETGHFSSDDSIGLFQLPSSQESGHWGVLEVTAADVQITAVRQDLGSGPSIVITSFFRLGLTAKARELVGLVAESTKALGRDASETFFSPAELELSGEVLSSWGAIATLAAWNLMATGFWEQASKMFRVEVTTVLGESGRWFGAERAVDAAPHHASGSTTFTARLAEAVNLEVYELLDEPLAADVKLYDAESRGMLLHATFCKRAGPLGEHARTSLKPVATSSGMTTMSPLPGMSGTQRDKFDAPPAVVSEMPDPEWTLSEHHPVEMRALDGIVRNPKWQPGQWRRASRQRERQRHRREAEKPQVAEDKLEQREQAKGRRHGRRRSIRRTPFARQVPPGVLARRMLSFLGRQWRKVVGMRRLINAEG